MVGMFLHKLLSLEDFGVCSLRLAFVADRAIDRGGAFEPLVATDHTVGSLSPVHELAGVPDLFIVCVPRQLSP